MFQSCLVCTDFSDGLYRLVEFVPELAVSGLKQIVFVHSVPLWEEGEIPRVDKEKIEQAQTRLSRALKDVPANLDVKVEVPSGRPSDTIPKLLEKYQSDVIISGKPICSLLEEKIFGSTSLVLAKSTATPLMTLRPELISTYTCEELALRAQHLWRYLLIPYNGTESARYLLDRIKELARQRPENSLQECLLCSVIEGRGSRKMLKEMMIKEAEEKLAQEKSELEKLGLKVHTTVLQGNPLQEILDLAIDYDVSAIAIGSVGGGSLFEWTKTSFANEVLRRSWFPVLFFSPKS